MNLIKLIGILTIIAGILGVLSPLSSRIWIRFLPTLGSFDIMIRDLIPIAGMVLSGLGIGFGVAVYLQRKWSWKANLVLQLILVSFLAASVTSYLGLILIDARIFPTNIFVLFGITITIIILLVRPKTRSVFGQALA
jgi:hypothetical protein